VDRCHPRKNHGAEATSENDDDVDVGRVPNPDKHLVPSHDGLLCRQLCGLASRVVSRDELFRRLLSRAATLSFLATGRTVTTLRCPNVDSLLPNKARDSARALISSVSRQRVMLQFAGQEQIKSMGE